jgi:hypothetical protein
MTQDEFDQTQWHAGMKAKYQDKVCPIVATDFTERLVQIDLYQDGEDFYPWARCENITLVA